MPARRKQPYEIRPLTKARWSEFEKVFGPSGGFWGCWRMYWRAPRAELEGPKRKTFRSRFKALVATSRRQASSLVRAVASRGRACALDARPVEVAGEKKPPVSLHHGAAAMFRRAGFKEIARRRDNRPLMRLDLGS